MEDNYRTITEKLRINTDVFSWRFFQMIRTIIITVIGRYFTKANSLGHAIELFKMTGKAWNPWILFDGSLFKLGLNGQEFFMVFLAVLTLIVVSVLQEKEINVGESLSRQNIYFKYLIYLGLIVSIVILGNYGSHLDTSSFIYQGF